MIARADPFPLILSGERESGLPNDLSISLNDFQVPFLYLIVIVHFFFFFLPLKKIFFRDLNSSVITDFKFSKQFSMLK